jgi:adenylyl- and sulfurtransferase ThiI
MKGTSTSSFSRYSFLIGKRVILIRLGGELGIKSRRTRSRMLMHLKRNIRALLVHDFKIADFRDRLILYSNSDEHFEELAHTVTTSISGVSSVSLALVVKSTEEDIISAGLSEAKVVIQPDRSFRVTARREGNHPFSSMEISAKLGEKILTSPIENIRVDLKAPDYQIYLDIRGPLTFIYTQIYQGIDGIPSQAQGTAIALIRPNSNSIFASWLMKKRGVQILPVFFKTGKSSENDFRDWIQQEFGHPLKIMSIQPILQLYKDEESLCLICQKVCEQICQNLAIQSDLQAISSPTCFNYNNEIMSLEAFKLLEKDTKVSVIRPIQMGYFNPGDFEPPLDKDPCCGFRLQVSLQISDNFKNIDFDKIVLKVD